MVKSWFIMSPPDVQARIEGINIPAPKITGDDTERETAGRVERMVE